MIRHRLPPPDADRRHAVFLCAAVVAVCLAYDHWRADLPAWWRSHGGGIPWVVFWVTLWFAVHPARRLAPAIGVVVVVATCALEFLQLWQPAWLSEFRSTRLGAAWLGGSFTWRDLPPYLMGGALGVLLVRLLPGRPAARATRRTPGRCSRRPSPPPR